MVNNIHKIICIFLYISILYRANTTNPMTTITDANFTYLVVSVAERTLAITGINPANSIYGNADWGTFPAIPSTYGGSNTGYNGNGVPANAFKVVEIAANAFDSLAAFSQTTLTSAFLPANLKRIGERAFAGVKLSGTLTVPATIDSVGVQAFYNTLITGIVIGSSTNSNIVAHLADLTSVINQEITDRAAADASLDLLKAPINNPVFTGTATIPSAVIGLATVSSASIAAANMNVANLTSASLSTATIVGNAAFAGSVSATGQWTFTVQPKINGELVATESYVNSGIASIAGPGLASALDTLTELASAIGGDPSFATNIITSYTSISATLSTEVSVRSAAAASLSSALSTSASSLTVVDSGLSTAVSAESSARIASVSSLSSALSANVSDLQSKNSATSTALSTEVSTRSSEVAAAHSTHSASVASLQSVDSALSTALSTETSARGSAVASLVPVVTGSETSLAAADTSLSTALSAETSHRVSAVASVSQMQSGAFSTLSSANTALSTALSTEVSARSGDISLLSASASLESVSLQLTHAQFSIALASETGARSTSVASLSASISGAVSSLTSANVSTSAALSAETLVRSGAVSSASVSTTNAVASAGASILAHNTALGGETSVRASQIDALSAAASASVASLATAHSAISSGLLAEGSNRSAAVSAAIQNILSGAPSRFNTLGKIASELSNNQSLTLNASTLSVVSALRTEVSSETVARGSAVASLSATAVPSLSSAEASMTAALSTETSARASAVASVSSVLSAASVSFAAVDVALSDALSAEAVTRNSAIVSVSQAVSSTAANLSATDVTLSTALSAEVSARQSGVVSVESAASLAFAGFSLSNAAVNTALVAETSARASTVASASSAISASFASLQSTDAALKNSVSALSSGLALKATASYADARLNTLLSGAPAQLDTLAEMAAALGNNPSFASSISAALLTKGTVTTANSLSLQVAAKAALSEFNSVQGVANNAADSATLSAVISNANAVNGTVNALASTISALRVTGGTVNASTIAVNGVDIPTLTTRIQELYYKLGTANPSLGTVNPDGTINYKLNRLANPTIVSSVLGFEYAVGGAINKVNHVITVQFDKDQKSATVTGGIGNLTTTITNMGLNSNNRYTFTVAYTGNLAFYEANKTSVSIVALETPYKLAPLAPTVTAPAPMLPFLSLNANAVTVQYTGNAVDVPTAAPLFFQATPRGTGVEWFAVVKQGMKAAISEYAGDINGPFVPPGQSQPVPFNNIVTTLMTNMFALFQTKSSFNVPIASWDTAAVTNMAQMFYGASAFNQPIGAWNTAAVTTMDNMFVIAYAFNQPIGTWNTAAVVTMNSMFYNATAFNQNISGWNVANVTPKPPTDFSTGSALTAQNTPGWVPIVLDANGTTIKYVGSAAAVPTSAALFFQANPRGTGVEWFAVVKQGMQAAISSYASGTDGPFKPPGQSAAVPFNNIVTTLMTYMNNLFHGHAGFNHPIASWDTAAVTNMSYMFYGASTFNQPIVSWNTAAVTNMSNMFNGAPAFNQAIGTWNTGAVTDMHNMFVNTTNFNQPIGAWNTGAVTDMNYMFYGATAFNQNISGWNVGAVVTKPPAVFSTGSALTAQNASVWFPIVQDANGTTIKYVGSAAAVPTSSALFIQANPRGTGTEWFAVVKQDMKAAISDYANGTNSQFRPPGQSQPVPFNNIVTTLMTDMLILFRSASFNQPIASWDTSAVTNMAQMFSDSTAFNQPIGAWNTAAVTNMSNMFVNTTNFNQAIGSWNTGAVTDMSYMFYGATAFNQPIDTWNTAAVTNMSVMFYGATAFNRPIGAWNTAAVTNMSHMFYSATAFNQPIGTWNTGAVTNMNFMFYGAAAFNQNISGWNVGAVVTKPPTNFSDGSALTAQNNPFGSAFAAPTLSGSITYSGNTANMTYAVAAGVTAVQVRKASDGSVITSGVISNQTASISVALTETISIVVVALGNASGRESAASATQELLVQYAAPTLSGGITYSGNTASMTYTVAAGVTAVQVRKASDGSVIASGVISNQTASISVALTETISIVVVALGNANGRESAASATQELLAQYAKPQSVSSLRTVTATTGFVDLYNSPYVSNRIYPGANLWDQPTGSKLSVTFNLNNTAEARRVIIGRYYNVASFNEYPFIYWGLETGYQNNVRFIMNDDRENAVSVINNVSTGINYTLTITTDKANNRLLFTAINADTSQQIGTQVTKTLTSGELAQFVTTDLFVTYINYYYENVFFTSIQLLGSVSNVTIAKYISSMFELSEYYLASAPKLRVFNNDGTQIGSDVTTTTAVNSVSYFKAVVTYESTMINQPVMKVKYMSSGSDNKRDSEFSDAVIGINIPVYAAPTISGSITYSGNTASMTYTVAAGVTAVQVRKASDGSVITSGVTTSVNTGNQTASVSIALTENVSIVVVALGNASGQESAASATQNLVLQTVETPVLSGSITYSGNTANMTYTVVPQVTAVQVRKASDGTVISTGVTTSVNTSNQTASVSIALTETISIVVVASNSSGLTSAASAQQTLIAQYAAPTLSGSITYSGNTASMTYAVAAGVTAVQVRKASDGSVIASGVTTSVSGTSASISVALTETISIVVVALGNANGRESAASAREALRVIYPAPVLSGSVTYSGSRANLTYTVAPSVYNALNFDGVNDGVNFGVPDWTYSSQILNTMTIECWFRTTDTNNQKSAAWFISRNSTLGSSGSHFALGMTSTGHITAWLQTNSIGNTFNVTGYGTYNDMQWHHVAVTYEQSTYYMLNGGIKLYIDGNLNIHRNDLNDRFYPLLFNNTTRLILGNDDAGLFGGQNDRQFRGSLAEVRVWNVVRTENEILNNYSRGLIGNESGLVMYNRLDQGITNGNNVGITTLVNNMISGGSTGTLQNFDLTGTVSNWVSGPSKIHDLQMRNATDNSVITNNVTIIGISSTSVSVSLSANPISVVAVSLGNVNGRESVASAPQAI